MTFDAWWELFGCRIVGDPVDYARAAFKAGQRIGESLTNIEKSRLPFSEATALPVDYA